MEDQVCLVLEELINEEFVRNIWENCYIPVTEEAGEGRLAVCLLDVLFAVLCLSTYCGFDTCRCLSFQAHLHLLSAETLKAGLTLSDAGDRLNASPQFHLQWEIQSQSADISLDHLTNDWWNWTKRYLITLVHLGDVVGAEVVNEFVKPLFGYWVVGFGKISHCFGKFSV